jgi:peptidoglycan-associated lipoprotein
MIVRRFVASVFAATLLVAACRSEPPPPPPGPSGPTPEELAQRRADSLARLEAQRRADSLAALAAAERERERAVAAARATLEEMVFFDYDMSEIRSDAAATLRAKVGILRASPQVQIRIEGHADERGSTEYNLAVRSGRSSGHPMRKHGPGTVVRSSRSPREPTP